MKVLETTHKERGAAHPAERRELGDLDRPHAPYYGTYCYSRPGTEGRPGATDRRCAAALHAAFNQSCSRCHDKETRGRARQLRAVGKSSALLARSPQPPVAPASAAPSSPPARARSQSPLAALAVLEEELRSNPARTSGHTPPLMDENPRYVYGRSAEAGWGIGDGRSRAAAGCPRRKSP